MRLACPVILPTYFEKFVSSVQPTDERVTAISAAHNTLRDHLTDDAELSFPVDDSFLSGSYARKTAIDPIKDADIILVLEHTTMSSDCLEPRPRDVLQKLRDAIDDFYDEVNLETQRRSIQVFLKEEDVRMDVVPAIAPDGKDQRLWVPDYHQGRWIESWPKAHIDHSREANAASDGHFVRVVKALKWWKSQRLDKDRAPKSFLLEVMTSQYLSARESLPETFVETTRAMRDALAACARQGTVPTIEDPGVGGNLAESCGWTPADVQYLKTALDALVQAGDSAIAAESKGDTIRHWQSVFGAAAYPATLAEEEERDIAKALTEHRDVHRALTTAPIRVTVSASVRQRGVQGAQLKPYVSGSYKVPKNYDIRFAAATNAPKPFTVRWTVQNHGVEARLKNDLERRSARGPEDPEQLVQWEKTGYRGHHYMLCEILRNGQVLASSRFTVRVK